VKVVVLTGGGGGAKLVAGFAAQLAGDELTAIVNTGDDFTHLGVAISPDLDSVMYILAGVLDPRGWGRANETFHCLASLRELGAESWFQLGDRDLAVHLLRTAALARGDRLTAITRQLCAAFGVSHRVLPMSDAPRPTWVHTPEGRLPFQRWYVEHRARPRVVAVEYEGDGGASAEVLAALDAADLVVLAPSNPYLSLGPILAVPGIRERIARHRVVAVSPLIAGEAVSGPLARMLHELGAASPDVAGLVAHYGDLVRTWVVDERDARAVGVAHVATDILLVDAAARNRLAAEILRL
jgi:LPPG:FO 2-phospho-L-lactate transferase